MTQYRAVLIDDELHCLDTLSNDIDKYCPEIEIVRTFFSPETALGWLRKNRVDVLFLDIYMPGMTGFQLLEAFPPDSFHVIFTTAFSEYAVRALRLSAVDFLEKPIDKNELIAAVGRLKERTSKNILPVQMSALLYNLEKANQVKRIGLPSKEGIDFFPVQEILYCEAAGSYVQVFLVSGGKKLVTRSLKEMESLLEDFPFCRIHNGFLINLEHVTRYLRGDGGTIEMTNGVGLPLSRNKKDDFLNRWRR